MTVLSVSHVSKKYAQQLRRALWYGVRDIAGELLARRNRPDEHPLRTGEFWALDDISFGLGRGESLAIVGHNGAGKSTLLRVLYGLLKPDRGEVRLKGRAEALIELGIGFHPQLTGRENVRLSAALYGLTSRQTAELYEKVVDFAELGDFLDAPIQSYSSGMRARLGYAIAAHLEPDVLMVDEVLAVGDLAFQRKCATHMRGYLARGGSLLLVSHNTYQIQAVCERGILLDRGRVAFSGTAVETLNAMFEQRLAADGPRPAAAPAIGPMVIEDLVAEPVQGDAIRTDEPVRITMRYQAETLLDVVWGFSIWTADGWICVAGEYDTIKRTITPGQGQFTCMIPRVPLVGGRYSLRAGVLDCETRQPIALLGHQDAGVVFDVRSNASALSNTKMTLNQLVTIDVDWR